MNKKITYNNSYLESFDGVDYLSLNEESYYKTGFAAGTLLNRNGAAMVKFLRNTAVKVILLALHFIYQKRMLEVKIPGEYKDELNGYSDATNIPYKNLVLVNLLYEILGCSGFAFVNPDGFILLGHNTDVPKWLAKLALYQRPLITNVNIPGKNTFTHVSLPGMMGAVNGFNDKGIALSSHDAGGVYKRTEKNNLSTSCFARMILENSENIEDVRKIAGDNPIYYPVIMMLASSKEKKVSIFEGYPSDFDITISKDVNYVFSSNHYRSEKMQKYHEEIRKGSLDRLSCLQDNLSGKNHLSTEEAILILKDHRNGLQRDITGYSIANTGTFQSFIFDITNKNIYISNGRKLPVSLHGDFVKISMA